MSGSPRHRPRASRPAVDEWGVYDPQQAGLEALFARLDASSHPVAGAEPGSRPEAIVLTYADAPAAPTPPGDEE